MPDGWQLDRIRGEKGLLVSDKFVYALRGQENICFRESETYGRRRRQRWSAPRLWSGAGEESEAQLI